MNAPKHPRTVIRTGTTDRLNFITGSTKDAAIAAKLDMIADKSIKNRSSIMYAYSNPDRLLSLMGLR